jgi:hypothetical protein
MMSSRQKKEFVDLLAENIDRIATHSSAMKSLINNIKTRKRFSISYDDCDYDDCDYCDDYMDYADCDMDDYYDKNKKNNGCLTSLAAIIYIFLFVIFDFQL